MKDKWNKMSPKKKNTLEIVLSLLLIASFFAYRLYSNYVVAKEEAKISGEIKLVDNNSRYFTVISCVEKYLNTVQSGNINNILLTLNDDYKETYGITANNVGNHIPKLDNDKMYSYSGSEMKEKRISKNVVEYYVTGEIQAFVLEGNPKSFKYDLTVILYESEFLFSIRPGVNV